MPSELLSALFKRRSSVDAGAETWESHPLSSPADAAHLTSLDFSAPAAQQWLQGLEKAPEEDDLKEAVAEELVKRGNKGPAHAPQPVDVEARVLALRQQLREEQASLGQQRRELEGWEAKLLEKEQELRQGAARDQDYPQPDWLVGTAGTLNIGVVGNAGVGKSLLVNRLRRIRPHAQGWAPVGVRETTMQPTMHAFPDEPRVRLWDIPGAGTAAVPAASYLREMGLRYFDKVLIVSAGRFTSLEVALRDELVRHNVPFFMVRTKVDLDVWNNEQDNGLAEAETLAQIRRDLQQNHGVAEPYLVSCRDPEAFDLPKLCRDLGLKKAMDPAAPCFLPSSQWADAWEVTPLFSPALAGLQGRWRDAWGFVYLVQGALAHVTQPPGIAAAVAVLQENSGQVWWCGRWFLTEEGVRAARGYGQVHWLPASAADRPLVWWWCD